MCTGDRNFKRRFLEFRVEKMLMVNIWREKALNESNI